MNILFIGDVVGKPGRDAVKYFLENNAEALGLDFVIANLENVSHGKGLQKNHFLEMMESGIDVNVNIKMYKKGKITMYKKRNKVCSY